MKQKQENKSQIQRTAQQGWVRFQLFSLKTRKTHYGNLICNTFLEMQLIKICNCDYCVQKPNSVIVFQFQAFRGTTKTERCFHIHLSIEFFLILMVKQSANLDSIEFISFIMDLCEVEITSTTIVRGLILRKALQELEFVLLYLDPVSLSDDWYSWIRDILESCACSKHLSLICDTEEVTLFLSSMLTMFFNCMPYYIFLMPTPNSRTLANEIIAYISTQFCWMKIMKPLKLIRVIGRKRCILAYL